MEGVQWVSSTRRWIGSRQEVGLAKTIIEVFQDLMPRVQFLKGAAGRGARMSRPEPVAGCAVARAGRPAVVVLHDAVPRSHSHRA
jgi:hypothetical protein